MTRSPTVAHERPILFSAPMVRAILGGRKTQTRRVIGSARVFGTPERPAFTLTGNDLARALQNADRFRRMDGDGWYWEADAFDWQTPHTRTGWLAHLGYAPGDRLWVRETWAHYHTVNHTRRSHGGAFDEVSDGLAGYRADGHDSIEDFRQHVRLMSGCDLEAVIINGDRWRPSIHMPRWASRITLEVTDVRVQRLRDISEEDARAEGVECDSDGWRDYLMPETQCCAAAKTSFTTLWEHINGPGSWATNPWVCAIAFRRIDQAGGVHHG